MTSWTYWRRFYRKFRWDIAYTKRVEGMVRWSKIPNAPPAMIAMNARMILESYYRGRWWAVYGHFKDALWNHYAERYAPAVEWVRTEVFCLASDPDIALIERMDEEDAALDELAKSL